MLVTYEDIRNDESIKCYITEADKALSALGYTEHSFPHVVKAATMAEMILLTLNYPKRTAELAKIAGYMHDIGNIVNRIDHAQSGAVMAFRLLDRMGMDPAEIAMVISAIGNHDESTAAAVNPIAAALILADKTDVRRSRVRNQDFASFDIHDRVKDVYKRQALAMVTKQELIGLRVDVVKQGSEMNKIRGLNTDYFLNHSTQQQWRAYYNTLAIVDLFFDNYKKAKDVAPERVRFYCGQGEFVKAMCYFYLVRMWGDAVITKGSNYIDKYAKSPASVVLDTAIHAALQAYDMLPKYGNLKNSNNKALTSKQYG